MIIGVISSVIAVLAAIGLPLPAGVEAAVVGAVTSLSTLIVRAKVFAPATVEKITEGTE